MTIKTTNLRQSVINSSLWSFGGYVIAQGLRFVSNIIMAKLLFPEAFGLMALIMVFIQGISLFSDIGIYPSIIQNKRGTDPIFLDTAWTMQVIRGLALWLITIIGAYPYATFYNEPLLSYMLPVAGFTAVIAGFNSTSLATANRALNLKHLTLIELIAQAVALFVMICWVYISPTVWGLVVGGLINSLIKLTLSHIWIADRVNRFRWEKESAKSLFKFGRWIFVSTALTFFAAQIDKLILGSLIGTASLGVYTIVVMFKDVAANAIKKLGSSVLFPSYSQLVRSNDHQRLYNALQKSRLIMIVFSWIAAFILIFIGNNLITLLYDERYKDAVWMIQILPFSSLVGVLSLTYQNVYLAMGKSSYISIILTYQLTIQIIAITIGYHQAGLLGTVIGLTLMSWLLYPANIIAAIKLKIWQPEIDIPVIALAGITVTAFIYFSNIITLVSVN